jgi:quinol-cytochrome oxidoreductase complex cytochrome b subunit/cytochrome c556
MSDASQSSSQIQQELLAEVQAELARRNTSQVARKPEPPPVAPDAISPLVASALLTCLALLAGTGIGLALVYAPSPDDAAASLDWMQRSGVGAWVRAMHWHGANLMVALCGAYLFWLVWRGLYRRPGQVRWWRCGALGALALAFYMTGQFLPCDQNALHGTVIRLGYLAEAPLAGPWLREMAAGGSEPGFAALARFLALHVIVLPAATLLLLRGLWGDARYAGGAGPVIGVAATVVALVALAALFVGAPLGLAGNPGEPFPQARPEWFGLALFLLVKAVPGGTAQQAVLFVPPALALAALGGLPFVETAAAQPARLHKPLRVAALVCLVAGLMLSLVAVWEDHKQKAGWFTQPELDKLMAQIGRRNEALGHSTHPLPANAHAAARDARLLSARLRGLYVADIEESQKAQWDQWATDMESLADRIITTTAETERRKLRAQLRQVCADCHKLHADEEIALEPKLPAPVARRPDPPPETPPARPLLDPARLAGLAPLAIEARDLRSTRRLMNRAKFRLRDLMRAAGESEGEPEGSPEQHFVDLREAVRLFGAKWDDNQGTHADKAAWDRYMRDLGAALDGLRDAKTGTDARARFAAVGKVCDDCHNAGDWTEPFEWQFSDLKR